MAAWLSTGCYARDVGALEHDSRWRALLALALALAIGCRARTPGTRARAAYDTGPSAFVGVCVVTMESPEVTCDRTVLVRTGRIEAIGPSATTVLPSGTQRIAGHGRFLMPGLADMHVHVADEGDFARYLSYGVTLVRNMIGQPMHLEWRRRLAEGSLLGPTLVTAGPLIDGRASSWPGSAIVETASQAQRVVDDQVLAGYDFIKVYSQLRRDAYDGVIAAARRHGVPVVGHVPWFVGLDHALAQRQASAEHLFGYADALETRDSPLQGRWAWRRMFHAVPIDTTRLPALATSLKRAGTWTCATSTAFRHWVPPPAWADWANPDLRRLGDENRKRIIAALAKGGAPLMLGTDTSRMLGLEPGASTHEELRFMVEAGLTPFEALRTATVAPAEFLGRRDACGSLTVGRHADLLLLAANPLTSLDALDQRAGVMIRGRWLPLGTSER